MLALVMLRPAPIWWAAMALTIGAVLALDDDGRIPALALQGAPVPNATSTITVPPATITFAVLTGPGAASAAGC